MDALEWRGRRGDPLFRQGQAGQQGQQLQQHPGCWSQCGQMSSGASAAARRQFK
jgi:hypothetical protein